MEKRNFVMIHQSQVYSLCFFLILRIRRRVVLYLVDVGNSVPNGLNNEGNDAGSLYGTTKSGPPTGWVNALASGSTAAPGVSGQSTISRKSGKEIIKIILESMLQCRYL
jgi:hypothetical protein